MSQNSKKNIVIIGSGIEGLTLANKLKDSAQISIFEKSLCIGDGVENAFLSAERLAYALTDKVL